ncbi:hypothetical protein BLS_009623 [Venturia inaequalis]|uniref:TPR domain-containing protein n=1 Tax=Venturia inaequalis TaxID=5025 RepID=A0A8H3URH8_VENIN|nr:hypothetical protein BLS_009623 [Venturia inaequalis]KAE9973923.1 hypothetical protein EG328_004156 [Venturia inaequalis]KAE9975366.1 hypothetical protein EG327_008491 [Venturia inaequalis]RDI89433.1 hypothetical protein Vi05172_g499 [Venturia inaequalis]
MFTKAVPRAAPRSFQCLARPRCRQELQQILRSKTRSLRPRTSIRHNTGYAGPKKKTYFELLTEAFRDNPWQSALAVSSVAGGILLLIYVNRVYHSYFIGAFHQYPDEVAKPMRKALYWDLHNPDPQKALKFYKEALRKVEEIGMDPFSKEVLGIKIQLASLFERYHNYNKAIEVLEIVRRDCYAWVDKLGGIHMTDGKRTRVLGQAAAMGVKLGELYSLPYVDDQEAAEAALVTAVETMLKEKRRREKEGVKDGEGDWKTDEEMGASFEALGHLYDSKDKHHLSAPLFLNALSLCPPKSCHSVILMNNLATSIAQQRPPPSFTNPTPERSRTDKKSLLKTKPSNSPAASQTPDTMPSPANYRAQATLWAINALTLSQSIKPPDRTEECDIGCAVATHNLGEFAEMAGDLPVATNYYREAESLAKGIGFEDGVKNAQEGLARVEKLGTRQAIQ